MYIYLYLIIFWGLFVSRSLAYTPKHQASLFTPSQIYFIYSCPQPWLMPKLLSLTFHTSSSLSKFHSPFKTQLKQSLFCDAWSSYTCYHLPSSAVPVNDFPLGIYQILSYVISTEPCTMLSQLSQLLSPESKTKIQIVHGINKEEYTEFLHHSININLLLNNHLYYQHMFNL